MPITEPIRNDSAPPSYQATSQDKLWTTITMGPDRAEMIRATYRYLIISCVAALAGGWLGSHWEGWLKFAFTTPGWIMLIIAINVIPMIAMRFSRAEPMVAVGMLALDGFVSGLALSPLVFLGMYFSRGMVGPSLVDQALVITAVIFAAVTGYIFTSRKTYSAPRGLMVGMFFAITGAIVLNMFFMNSLLATVITAGIGIFGVLTLVYATSKVLLDPEYDNPVYGALALFASLFNIFQAVLRILIILSAGGRRN